MREILWFYRGDFNAKSQKAGFSAEAARTRRKAFIATKEHKENKMEDQIKPQMNAMKAA
ncbi:MAG: hypothetical protein PHD76_02045 [Methylacidiphilales bacterium]|nr:hypothetical protein [Candidatus Methylacidiphilales bacterium]